MPSIGHNPFYGKARPITLATAIATAGYPFPLPDAPRANPHLLTYVWSGWWGRIHDLSDNGQGGITREIVLEYAKTGVRVLISPVEYHFPRHPLHAFRIEAGEFPDGSAGTIGGLPALVLTGTGGAAWPTGTATSVELIDSYSTVRLNIDVIGSPWISRADVIAIARSVATAARSSG